MTSIVTNPNTDYFWLDTFSGLRAILDRLIEQTCRTTATTTMPCRRRPVTTSPPNVVKSVLWCYWLAEEIGEYFVFWQFRQAAMVIGTVRVIFLRSANCANTLCLPFEQF